MGQNLRILIIGTSAEHRERLLKELEHLHQEVPWDRAATEVFLDLDRRDLK